MQVHHSLLYVGDFLLNLRHLLTLLPFGLQEEDYAGLYPNNTIISGVVYLPVTQVEPGVVEMGPLERFEIGTYPANASAKAKAQVQRLSAIWKAGGATAPV